MKAYSIAIAIGVMTMMLTVSCRQEELTMPDSGTVSVSPLSRAAEDPETIQDFRRLYGVGFSYDALYGERNNMKDIRCQVLDYSGIMAWQDAESWHQKLVTVASDNETSIKCSTSYSRSEYVQSTVFQADVKAEMIVFNGSFEANISTIEAGETNDFYSRVEYQCPALKVSVDGRSLRELIQEEGHTEFLAPNFREVLKWMETHRSDATIDSLIARYGSHVVTYGKFGGSLTIDMTMKQDSLTDVINNKTLGKVTVGSLLNKISESKDEQKTVHMINGADCNISIRGGDLNKIPYELLHFEFGRHPDLSKCITDWNASISYDADNYYKSNLEIVEMDVMPIWYFIPDEELAERVRLRVQGTAKELIKKMGYQNAVSTSFTIPQSLTCLMGGKSISFTRPLVMNVISSGRYVATVCRERIEAISTTTDMRVVYPIYDRKANFASGYCVNNGVAYSVRWIRGKCHVERIGYVNDESTIYLTDGVPGSRPYASTDYLPSHVVVDYEWPFAIRIDGSLDSSRPYYLVRKRKDLFYLRNADGSDCKQRLDGLPNWSYDADLGRMVRNKDYVYYWNPLEINY